MEKAGRAVSHVHNGTAKTKRYYDRISMIYSVVEAGIIHETKDRRKQIKQKKKSFTDGILMREKVSEHSATVRQPRPNEKG